MTFEVEFVRTVKFTTSVKVEAANESEAVEKAEEWLEETLENEGRYWFSDTSDRWEYSEEETDVQEVFPAAEEKSQPSLRLLTIQGDDDGDRA
jgi:hypothetical protein